MGFWDDDFGFKMAGGALKLMGKAAIGTGHMLANVVRGIRFKGNISSVQRKNKVLRGVEESQSPTSVAELRPFMNVCGKMIVSGDKQSCSPWRNVFAAAYVKNAVEQNVGAVVIHSGDSDLLARLQDVVPEERLIYVGPEWKRYDPLKGYSDKEVISLLLDKKMSGFAIGGNSRILLQALVSVFMKIWKMAPSLKTLMEMLKKPISEVQKIAQEKLPPDVFKELNANLQAGAVARPELLQHLSRIVGSLSSIVEEDKILQISKMVSIRQAVEKHQVLVLDLFAEGEELGLAVLMNEILSVMNKHNMVLVLDNPDLLSTEKYRNFIRSEYKGGLCLTTQDLCVKCADNEKDFQALTGGCSLCVVMTHDNGTSAMAWQNFFGNFRKTEITYHQNKGQGVNHGQFFGNSHMGQDVGYAEKDDPRVLAEQIMKIPEGNVFIQRADTSVILHTVLNDTI